jgi:ATP-binding cassette subfamily B protein
VLTFSIVIAGQFGASAGSFSQAVLSTTGSLARWRRIFEMLDERPELTERLGAITATGVRGRVRFEAVSFAYPGAREPALRDIDVEIPAGRWWPSSAPVERGRAPSAP